MPGGQAGRRIREEGRESPVCRPNQTYAVTVSRFAHRGPV